MSPKHLPMAATRSEADVGQPTASPWADGDSYLQDSEDLPCLLQPVYHLGRAKNVSENRDRLKGAVIFAQPSHAHHDSTHHITRNHIGRIS